jgi:4-hydroxythreonine-4-phosphate dehydrogenase
VARAALLAAAHGAATPRIAVCGLNPHAGEGGLIGTEEQRFLDPRLDAMRERHPGLSRCLPGDTVFWRARRGEFDVVVALYHDQALAPLKTLEFDRAVNVTLGLPWVRTSPDHGTAFALAREGGEMEGGSFARAVEVASLLAKAPGTCTPSPGLHHTEL